MKKFNNLLLFIIISTFLLFSCNKKLVTSSTTNVIDSVVVTHVIDTTMINVANDTLRFDSLLVQLFSLQGLIDNLDSTSSLDRERAVRLIIARDNVIKGLSKGVYTDTTYEISLIVEYQSSDSVFTSFNFIDVKFENGKISHNIRTENVTIPTETIITNIKVEPKITLWIWLKDKRTLILLLIMFIFMVIKKLKLI